MIVRSITDRSQVDLLVSCSAKRAASARWVHGLLDRGESRLRWCRVALTEDGELLAAHALDSWSPDGAPLGTPTSAHLLGHTDERAAVALLTGDLRLFDAGHVEVRLVQEEDAPAQLRTLRESQQRVLAAAGFAVDVDRVQVEWTGSPPTGTRARLRFRPAATVAEVDLVELFAAVADGSVDHAMVRGRDQHGRRQEAVTRLGRARRRTFDDDWFVVGVDGAGLPVGYVQAARTDDRAVLAEIGVVASQRGHRHVDELLAHGTGVLVADGATRIRASTDSANHAMRAAFRRGGYAETGSRRDFRRPATAT